MTLPDSPLANVALIDQNSATHPATTIADRVDVLNSNGHAWMPADMQTTLAGAPTSDASMLSTANSIKQTLSKAWNGFTEATDDNVLHKQPTAGLALTRMLNSSLGPLPVAEPDLSQIQQNLQAQGFGGGLTANGVWGADWNDAYNGWSNHVINRQLAGDQPGSISTQSAGHSIWDDLLPSHAVDSIVGYAKSLPGDVRDLAANLVGSVVNTATGNESKSDEGVGSPGANAATDVERFLGNKNAGKKVQQEVAHPWASTLQDVGTVLAFAPIAGQGSAAAAAARGELERGVTMEAAQRGPGVIAKSLFGGLDKGVAEDTARRGLLNSRVVTNIPLLGQTGPLIGKLADADGAYYRIRTLLAAPYALPTVRIAGDVGQRTMLTGAALRAGAQVAQAVGGGSTLTSDIQNTNVTNDIDRNLDRIAGTPGEHPFTDFINSLGYVLHGPLGDAANSTAVGNAVQSAQELTGKAFGDYGVEGAWERGITAATGKKTTIQDLQKAFGSEELADRFLTMKTAEFAAAHAAQRGAQEVDGLTYGDDGYRASVGAHADAVWADPGAHQAAIREMTANKATLQNRFMADALHADINSGTVEQTDVDSYVRGAKAWMDAGGHITDLVKSGLAREMFGANGLTVIKGAQDAFDFGYGSDNPTRLLSTTRRDFVGQAQQLFGRVSNGVDKARIQTGRDVATAQQAEMEAQAALSDAGDDEDLTEKHGLAKIAVTAAKQRQQQVEAAISSGDLHRLSTIMADSSHTKASQVEWEQLAKDHRDLRNLIKPTLAPGETYNLPDMLDRGIDPDNLYTRINGEPRTPDVAPGSAEWIRQNLNLPAGTLGLGRLETKSIQQATSDINGMLAAANRAATSGDEDGFNAVLEQMRDYGFEQLGLTQRTLGAFDDPQRLADILNEHAQQLASDVFTPADASPELARKLSLINQAGYKPMLGSHIGHIWDGSLPPIDDLKGAVGYRRRFTDALGLGVTAVSAHDKAQDTQLRVLREIDRVLHEPGVKVPPRTTAETYIQVLRDKDILPPTLPLPEKLVYTTTKHLGFHAGIKQLAEKTGDIDQAAKEYEQGLAETLGVREIPRRQAMKALATEATGTGPNGEWHWMGSDPATNAKVLTAIRKAYADRPNYLFGLSTLEDHFRSFSLGGHIANVFPNSGALQAFANAPNELIELRNRLRFTLSPFFDARRLTKTNFKMGLDGVTPVLDPLVHMVKDGTFDEAHALLNNLIGEETNQAGFDDVDRYLHSQSIWGKYNARHFEAYYAHEKKAQGATDDEIKTGIRRVFEYGSTRVEGRTPIESTMNTLFFPFSFEKNLLRNTGMYFLDHPQQALLLTGAMEGYRKANQNDAISQWTQDHLPILNDLQKLNAFAHGISPGQPGGINAPLLNLFLPQLWEGKDFSKKNVEKLAPVITDFGSLFHDSVEQGIIAKNASENAVSYAVNLGKPRGAFDPYKPTITPFAQRRDAEVMRNGFITALSNVLSKNAQAASGDKITWPDDTALPSKIQGQPIDRTTIGYLVQRWYPAYDPGFSQTFAVEQEESANNAIAALKQKNPAQAQQWGVLVKLANSTQTHLNDDTFDTAQAAQVMTQFRELSVSAAESEPGFLAFYNSHFKYLFGPIESVKGAA